MIKKRGSRSIATPRSKTKAADKTDIEYFDYRRTVWGTQNRLHPNANFHSDTYADGTPFQNVMFAPQNNLHMKDVWHCPSQNAAKHHARKLLSFPDVVWLEVSAKWVYVRWDHKGRNGDLKGPDGRETVTGIYGIHN